MKLELSLCSGDGLVIKVDTKETEEYGVFGGAKNILDRTIFPEIACRRDEGIIIHPNGEATIEKLVDMKNNEATFIDGGRVISFVDL